MAHPPDAHTILRCLYCCLSHRKMLDLCLRANPYTSYDRSFAMIYMLSILWLMISGEKNTKPPWYCLSHVCVSHRHVQHSSSQYLNFYRDDRRYGGSPHVAESNNRPAEAAAATMGSIQSGPLEALRQTKAWNGPQTCSGDKLSL